MVDRPLVFLCGPHEDPAQSRREKTLRFINAIKLDDARLVPIIVDDLFEKNFVENNELDLSLLEEIVSVVSYKTYIFLDSMSTSYELGLFTNHFANNQVTVFLEKGYKERGMNSIGGFIQNSFSNIVEYSGDRSLLGKISFAGGILPSQIESSINGDAKKWHSQKLPLVFKPIGDINQDFGVFYVEDFGDSLRFHISLKTFFYILSYAYKEHRDDFYSEGFSHLKEEIYFHYLAQLKDTTRQAEMILKKPQVSFSVAGFSEKKLVHHIVSILQRIEEINKRKASPYVIWTQATFSKTYEAISFDLLSLISDNPQKAKRVLASYHKRPEDFVKRKRIYANRKFREITTYSNNANGRYLRDVHETIVRRFSSLVPPAEGAYAYKKGCCPRKCVSEHLESVHFIKLDIHHFFDSISYRILLKKLYSMISGLLQNSPIVKISHSEVRAIFNCCFYRWHLPIGFVTSPLLSDYYMHHLDVMMLSECQNLKIVYTRYADDFLISSSQANDPHLNVIEKSIGSKLLGLRLSQNGKKRFEANLIKPGSSIKFLGIVITHRLGRSNSISISRSTLVSISKNAGKALRGHDRSLIKKTIGQIEYVRTISDYSFNKLVRMISIKTGKVYKPGSGF